VFLTKTVLCCAYYAVKSSFEVKTKADDNDLTELPHNDTTKPCLSTMKNSPKVHQEQHTGENCYSCTECEKYYSNRNALRCHVNIHKGKYKCTECGRCCSSKTCLEEHRQRHLGQKMFKCTVCSKRFTRSWELTLHGKTHSGEKLYKCYVCEKTFGRYEHLKVHLRIHTGEKPYRCSVCNRSFATSTHLKRHKCSVQSSASDELTEHGNVVMNSRIHNEKIYKCYECDRVFSRCEHLKVHMRLHTGEKPYKCSICSKHFTTSSQRKAHQGRMHSSATDELKQNENVKFECVSGDRSVEDKEENLPIMKLEPDDVRCV